MMSEEEIITINNASIGYRRKSSIQKVVKENISLHALKGELVALIGGNGVGKSTLLRTIAGFQPVIEGDVLVRGKFISSYKEKELALNMSFVSTEIIRVSNLTVFDLISLGRYPHTDWSGKLTDEDLQIVQEAIEMGNLAGGFITGHNYLKITNYAEKFEQTKKTLLSAVSVGIAKVVSPVNNTNSNVKIQVYEEDSIHGLPGQELISMNLPLNLLSPVKMNFISLDNPLVVKGKYFIGYEINYINSSDTFAIYHTPNRPMINNNMAYAKQNGYWKPFYAIPQIGISTSLLIDSHGCESILSNGTNLPPDDEVNKFQVLYPQTGISNYVYLRNNGVQEFVSITLYDILGKKFSIQQQMVTSVPQVISLQNYNSGVYFLTVESLNGLQVIKIRINKAG